MCTHNESRSFGDLSLKQPLLSALEDLGYASPSPIQALTIPPLLEGRDVVGQAQTGTGKTAAFALPLLSRIDPKRREPQILVLTPTRELAIQVSEAFSRYGGHMKGIRVLPIYGGQSYDIQLSRLKSGVHVVVGTPGRVMDHLRRKTLNLDSLSALVLDEADEMLHMGFIEDVEWIIEQTPADRQVALFSATMPPAIRSIAKRHLRDPEQIIIETRTSAAETIRQRHWLVSRGLGKFHALLRILETETFDGMLIFVKTKNSTLELSERLEEAGYACAPLSGDISQNQRERTVENLKSGRIDIVVATDVAARGLDVDRISHVLNFDLPSEAEAYVHRIGRTGRAGRTGEAISFVYPNERRTLGFIERTTKQKMQQMDLPSVKDVNKRRLERFGQRITETLQGADLELFEQIIAKYQEEHETSPVLIAAALAKLAHGDKPLLLANEPPPPPPRRMSPQEPTRSPNRKYQERRAPEEGMEKFRLAVGRVHGVQTGNIVGAIANEAGISSEFIGRVEIDEEFSTVDLPAEMPRHIFQKLQRTWVCQQQLRITPVSARATSPSEAPRPKFQGKKRPEKKGKKGVKVKTFGQFHKKEGRKASNHAAV